MSSTSSSGTSRLSCRPSLRRYRPNSSNPSATSRPSSTSGASAPSRSGRRSPTISRNAHRTFDSRREYLEQIDRFKRHQGKPTERRWTPSMKPGAIRMRQRRAKLRGESGNGQWPPGLGWADETCAGAAGNAAAARAGAPPGPHLTHDDTPPGEQRARRLYIGENSPFSYVECSAGRLARAFLGGNFEKPRKPVFILDDQETQR